MFPTLKSIVEVVHPDGTKVTYSLVPQENSPGPADARFYDRSSSSNGLTKEQAAFKEHFGYYPPNDVEEIGIKEKEKRVALKALDTHDWRKGTPFWDVKASA